MLREGMELEEASRTATVTTRSRHGTAMYFLSVGA